LSTARSLLGSTLFGIVMTAGLHYYKGMLAGLAIQTVMAPLNLAENAIVKALFLGKGLREDDKIFEEKTASELTADDEVVDGQGNTIPRNRLGSSAAANNAITSAGSSTAADPNKKLEEIMLDTWDAGTKADLTELMSALNKKNCNYQTSEDQWTCLMLLSGLGGVSGTTTAIRHVWHELGADAALTDKEGWNAAHWAAFHGSIDAAKELRKDTSLLMVKDKEGNTPIETAKNEKNDQVASLFEEALVESKKSK
jgi:Phosphate transport (Pho88)